MARAPLLPASITDPTGLDPIERASIKDFDKRINQCVKLYEDLVGKITFTKLTVNRDSYQFNILPEALSAMVDETNAAIDEILLQGGKQSLWFMDAYVRPAYSSGTKKAITNISVQSSDYAQSRSNLERVFFSDPYQRRLGLIRAREFELMQGLSADVKKDLSQVLTDGLGRGLNPRDIAENISKRTEINQGRAHRIARTEIPQAFKAARREESEQAMSEFGFRIMMLHISAMSPTTRKTHAMRNGELHTIQEQQDWYAVDANSIACKCSEIEQLVDEKGDPLSTGAIDKARSRKLVYAGMPEAA